ncbi:hypothetical protein CoNPh34_CDS0028 [Staphylococcus phage S-CoN_Ph34]|nr:hypothetical protein CoNPh34_CDS0028 [Staphylococcus phage S-CoN_Ph34]WNM55661.1 hypothetical protein CoNPh36_CDS0019 [Staphylococcus phage S-CoN_Ph36]
MNAKLLDEMRDLMNSIDGGVVKIRVQMITINIQVVNL